MGAEILFPVVLIVWTISRFMRCEVCHVPFNLAQAFYRVVSLERKCSSCLRNGPPGEKG
jgi:hypothetical protein